VLLERVFAAAGSGWRANCVLIEPPRWEALDASQIPVGANVLPSSFFNEYNVTRARDYGSICTRTRQKAA
jgi:hypothetical protein